MEITKREFNSVQALRFIAAFMVVCCHATFYTKERLVDSVEVFSVGANGVPLFFVISGFVIVLSSRKLTSLRDGWKKFAVRRIIRIVPLYWLITTLKIATMIAAAAVVLHSELNIGNIVKSFFFIPTTNIDGEIKPILGVGWTLNFEMFFYLLFTIALFLRVNAVVFSGIVMVVLTVLSFYKTADWPVALNFYADPIVINFLLGMIAAVLVNRDYKMNKWLSVILIVLCIVILFYPAQHNLYIPYVDEALVNAFLCFIIVHLCVQMEKHSKVNIPKPVLYFGAASYSLYLVHPIIAPLSPVVFKKAGIYNPYLSVVFCIVLALIAAAVTYSFFEKPVTDSLNRKFSPKKLAV